MEQKNIFHSAVRPKPKAQNWLRRYLMHHGQAFFSSLGKIYRNPVTNFLTIAVIGIALALPFGFYIILQNIKNLTDGWHNNTQISLFLKNNISADDIAYLSHKLKMNPDIAQIKYISPQEGLAQFEKQAGFDEALQLLNFNPLPAVMIIQPTAQINSPLAVKQLMLTLKELPQVAHIQLDMQWVKQLYAIIALGQDIVWSLGILLGFAVILIVGNTILLAVQYYQREIEVTKLIGATNGFVRRPFLYTGLIYGFAGALLAWILIGFLFLWLNYPISTLAKLYHSHFVLYGFNLETTEILFILGMLLGLIGAWFAVIKQLHHIDP